MLNKDMPLLFILIIFMSLQKISNATDTITTTQSIRDGETLVSSDGSYELGFFSPGNTKNRYVGMWYKKITVCTVVWVANREVPLTNRSGVLKVIEPGLLVLLNDTNGGIIWSSNNTARPVKTPVAKLLDSGNLVVEDENDDAHENFVWESFNHPTDTLLPGMKFGWNFIIGLEVYLSSWKTSEDPSSGEFTYHFDPSGYPQHVLKKGSIVQYKTGPWNGVHYSGLPYLRKNPNLEYRVVLYKNEAYYSYKFLNSSFISRLALSSNGVVQRWTWDPKMKEWKVFLSAPVDNCDNYGLCGAYGSCNSANSPNCGCLARFLPRNGSNGCVRRTLLNCQNGDVFLKYSGIKLPDTQYSRFNKTMTLHECKVLCSKNCSCMAYTQLDISKETGCLLWFTDLFNIKVLPEEGQDIYIRMASSELDKVGTSRKILEISLLLPMAMVLLGVSLMLYLRKMKKRNKRQKTGGRLGNSSSHGTNIETQNKDIELPLFDLHIITKATDNFHNKLGEGGFGAVYKGMLEDGQEIAVKRLSRNSLQGLDEFKNEVIYIAKLQHRNLVKLLGCCIQGEEKILIYEYMPNRSLDLILFDSLESQVLDWPRRFHIINGIARGLLYLHQDSRLRIIHRDLKTSNILLDLDMNPKISDFGMARSFGGNETGANTSRVVGTYGYMSPEYAIDGMFSVKSDVFSFGVIVLETVSGKRNRGFSHKNHHHNLLGHAWMLYKEGRSMELVDANLDHSGYLSEVFQSIHVGLLCVQQCPEDRPSMSEVVLMLQKDGILPHARQPGFFAERNLFADESSSSTDAASSVNQMSITMMEVR